MKISGLIDKALGPESKGEHSFWTGLRLVHARPPRRGVVSANWTDHSPMDYGNPSGIGGKPNAPRAMWPAGQPNAAGECVIMRGRGAERKWSTMGCDYVSAGDDASGVYTPIGYICKAKPVIPASPVTATTTTTTTSPPPPQCPSGWSQFGKSCFEASLQH